MPATSYAQGLHDLGQGIYAYLQPPGTFGFSNAGLIVGRDHAVVVDTLFDLPRTRAMLAEMAGVTDDNAIVAAINTHGDGDHWFGNAALPADIDIHASRRALENMSAFSPQSMYSIRETTDGSQDLHEFVERMFAPFHWDGPTRLPTRFFDQYAQLDLDGRIIELIEVGSAHSRSDTFVHIPDASAVIAGDLVYGGAFVPAKESVSNLINGLDRIIALEPAIVVAGHGPVTDLAGVRAQKDYLEFVLAEARRCFDAGMDVAEAADDIDLSAWSEWGSPQRIVLNVEVAYYEMDPSRERRPEFERYAEMASYLRRRALW